MQATWCSRVLSVPAVPLRAARRFLLYHFLPFDKSIFGRLRSWQGIALQLVASFPALLVRASFFSVLLACMLEGPSLCRLSALTTNALRAAFADILAPVWVCKHQLLLESAFPTPDDEAGATELCAHSESAAKAAYARSWSALERRCPRCGRRSPARRADGSLFLETGKFMHLCDWLVPKAPQ